MSKLIEPKELAELISGLLVNPTLLGALDTQEQYDAFVLDIGQVVGRHCGGEATHMSKAKHSDEGPSLLSVLPNDELPSLNSNAWSIFDPSGWDDLEQEERVAEIPAGSVMAKTEIKELRAQLQTCLLPKSFTVPFVLEEKAYEGKPTAGFLTVDRCGLSIQLDGYSDNASMDSFGFPIFIEKYEGEVINRIFSNINLESPTHTIRLNHARNENRIED